MPRIGGASATKVCPFCNARNDVDAVFCARCNKFLGEPTKKMLIQERKKEKKESSFDRTYADYPTSAKNTARLGQAGIWMMIIGILLIVDVVLSFGLAWQLTQAEDYDEIVRDNPEIETLIPSLAVCESIRLIFACFTIIGGLSAMRRMNFGLAILGCVLGLLASISSFLALVWIVWGAFMLLGFLGSIAALVQVLLARREFKLA